LLAHILPGSTARTGPLKRLYKKALISLQTKGKTMFHPDKADSLDQEELFAPVRPFAQPPDRGVPELMRLTQLRGLRVISLSEALKMGRVEDILLDPTGRWVAALRVRSGNSIGHKHLIMRESVKRVGQHAVILGAPATVAEETNMPEMDRLIDLKTFIGLEVVTDEGTLLGRIHDAELDPETLTIQEYELTRNFWDNYLKSGLRVAAQATLSGSKDVLIVPQSALRKRRAYSEGPDAPKEW
jgi:uncharacterized protein YrrD